jgi:outer membrane protein assembly factor BamB
VSSGFAVHITAVCPTCQSSYQLQPSLRGQTIRCPNPGCRKAFTVADANGGSSAAGGNGPSPGGNGGGPPKGSGSGLVGDMVPVLPAEAAAALPFAEEVAPSQHVGDVLPVVQAEAVVPPPPSAGPAAPAWKEPPPVRRAPTRTPQPPAPEAPPAPSPPAAEAPSLSPEPAAGEPEGPRELPPGAWEPPPVRRGAAAAPAVTAEADHAPAPAPRRPRWARRIVWGFAALVVLALAGGGAFVVRALWVTESGLAEQAEADYKAGRYAAAKAHFGELVERFGKTSDKTETYRLMQDLCDLRDQSAAPGASTQGVLDGLDKFLDDHKDQPAVRDRAADLTEVVARLAEDADDRYGKKPPTDEETPIRVMDRIVKSRDNVHKVNRDAPTHEQADRITKADQSVRAAVKVLQQQNAAFARLKAKVKDARSPSEAVLAFEHQLKREAAAWPEIVRNKDVIELRQALLADHLKGVGYRPAGADLASPAFRGDDAPLLVVAPRLDAPPGRAPKDDPVVLALARGLLYALRQSNGQIKWVMRVGVDSAALPVRVPAEGASPERILALSADDKTLTALDDDGEQQWAYQLSAECIGKPLVYDHRAFLPTYDGKVHEIELTRGRRLGVYDLGQPLTVGGALQAHTGLLYFPADEGCVYVLDAKNHGCKTILYTGHPAGSIRAEPLILSPDPALPDEGWLVLDQTDGLGAVRLRAYPLPLTDPQAPPLALTPPPRVAGWTWFPPHCDTEKVALVSDAGVLGLFGVRQPRNPKDPELFPLFPAPPDLGGADLTPFLGPAGKALSRSEMVETDGDDYWVLARGKLLRLRLGLDFAAGPKWTPVWGPLEVGSPLHESQVVEDRRLGRSTLYLVTRPLNRQTCVATAVDDETGAVAWQRQLGLVCRGEPLALRPGGPDGPAVLLALDQGGGVVLFDPLPPAARARTAAVGLAAGAAAAGGDPWAFGFRGEDHWRAVAPSLDDHTAAPQVAPVLLAGPDGRTAYEVAFPGDGRLLVVRTVVVHADGQRVDKDEKTLPLPAPPAGPPVLAGDRLLLPLANGVVARAPLTGEWKLQDKGPNWRPSRPDERSAAVEQRVSLAPLGKDDFLVGDGVRGLSHFVWTADDQISFLPEGGPRPTQSLRDRLVGDLLVLPGDKPRRVCTAEADGEVYVWAVAAGGKLEPVGNWLLNGRVTAGPFLRFTADGAERIGCVIDHKQLVWIDPKVTEKVLWRSPENPDAEIIGRPEVVGDLLVVADQSGKVVGLDETTGKPVGPGYTLRGSVAAAASPVAFGPYRLFVPLTDGAVLLPEVSRLRAPVP